MSVHYWRQATHLGKTFSHKSRDLFERSSHKEDRWDPHPKRDEWRSRRSFCGFQFHYRRGEHNETSKTFHSKARNAKRNQQKKNCFHHKQRQTSEFQSTNTFPFKKFWIKNDPLLFNGTRTATESVNTHRRAQIPRTAFFHEKLNIKCRGWSEFAFVLCVWSIIPRVWVSYEAVFQLEVNQKNVSPVDVWMFLISSLFVQKCWKFRSFRHSCRAIVGCVRSLASGAVRKRRRGDSALFSPHNCQLSTQLLIIRRFWQRVSRSCCCAFNTKSITFRCRFRGTSIKRTVNDRHGDMPTSVHAHEINRCHFLLLPSQPLRSLKSNSDCVVYVRSSVNLRRCYFSCNVRYQKL